MKNIRLISILIVIVLIATVFSDEAFPAANNNRIPVLIGFRRTPGPSEQALVRSHGGAIKYSYTVAPAIAASIPQQAIQSLLNNPNVTYIEPDIVMQAFASSPIIPTGVDRINAEGVNINCEEIGIAIIDTGIDKDHPDLNVQSQGIHYFNNGASDNNFDDDNGHGTHVSGTAAARGIGVVGVAPNARLYAVKVLNANGSGYMSDIIKGVEWVVDHAGSLSIQVANMSLGGIGSWSQTFYNAMYNKPVIFTIAAGNNARDIFSTNTNKQVIPAIYGAFLSNVRVISAMADSDGKPGGLGSSTAYGHDDSFATFSNYSSVKVDNVILGRQVLYNPIAYILPGVNITSTYPGGTYQSGWSGTSMASPHAAGLIALWLAGGNVNLNGLPYMGLYDYSDPDGNYEPLPYAYYGNVAPYAEFNYSIAGLSVSFIASSSSDIGGTIISYAWNFGDGQTDAGKLTSHTYATAGTYTVTLTVTDNDNATDTATANVTISSPGSEKYMSSSLSDIQIVATRTNKKITFYKGVVNVTIFDSVTGQGISGAVVSGHWSGDASDYDSGSTGINGTITFESDAIKNGNDFAFTIDNVVKSGWIWIP